MIETLLPMLPVIGVLLAGAFFFSGTETALFSMQKIERQALAHDSLGRRVLALLERRSAVITTVLIGNETVNITLAAITATLVEELAPGKPWLTVVVLTPVLVLFAEITPKVLAFRFASSWVRWAVLPMGVFYTLVTPIRIVVGALVNLLARGFGVYPRPLQDRLGERELMSLLDRGADSGAVGARERDIVEAVFDFGELTVGRLMTPRPDIFAVPIDLSWGELLHRCRDAQFSRVPIYQRRIDDIIGVLLIKDLLRYRVEAGGSPDPARQIRGMLVPATFVPSSKPANAMLREFLVTKQHMAFVVDEHGTLVGLVTLDDLLSELVGEFLDHGEEPDPEAMQAVGDTWRVKAWTDIDDFAEEAGLELPSEGFTTVGGFVFHELGRLPRKGDVLEWSGWRFEVGSMEGRRIGEVTVTPPAKVTPVTAGAPKEASSE